MPILTRLYSPEVIGKYTYIISVSAIFMSVINGRYDVAIVTEKNECNVFPLIKLSLLCGLAMTLVASVSIGSYFFLSGKEVWMIVYVFLILLSFALVDVFTSYNNRHKEYKIITSVYILRTSIQNIGGILGGFISNSVHFLALPYAMGLFAGLRRQVKPLRPYLKEIMAVPYSEVKRVARVHIRQPLFSAPALLVNSLSYSLITILLESLYGLEQIGYYSVSVRLLGLPLALIGTNVSKVYVEQAAKAYNDKGSFTFIFKKTFLLLLAVAIPMVIILFLWATPICRIVLGEKWIIAGEMIAILAPMFGFRLVTSAMSPSFVIVNRQKMELCLQSLFLVSNLICFVVAKIFDFRIMDYLKVLSLLYSFCYLTYLMFIYKYSKKRS